jgi:hypothetical protein
MVGVGGGGGGRGFGRISNVIWNGLYSGSD